MTGGRILDWLGLIFVVAIVFVLVRPGSTAAVAVKAFGDMIIAMVSTATDIAR